jgi:hypothetical protein
MEREPGGLRSREQISPQEIPQLMVNLRKIAEEKKEFAIDPGVVVPQISEYLKTGDGNQLKENALRQASADTEEDGYMTGVKAYKWLMEQGGIEPPTELS